MKAMLALCVLTLIGCSLAADNPPPRGCIYIMGMCYKECEVGTHSYSLGCAKKTPEPTCDNPNPVEEDAIICDYSACYCNSPTVRDTVSGKCVALEDCPKSCEGED